MRRSGLVIQFANLGAGEVNTVMARDQLLPIDRAYIQAPLTPSAINCRLLAGVVSQRPGYRTIGTTPTSLPITGMYQALFDTNLVENLRSDTAKTYRLAGGTTWTDIAANGVGGNWAYAMVRRAGAGSGNPANQLMLCADGDGDSIYTYPGGATTATAVATSPFKGARAIVGHRGRALLLNVFDVGLNIRKNKRIGYSIVGDPTDFNPTHFGAGFVDLDDDPYPIVAGRVLGGNVCVFSGNNIAGSIVVGTLTGVTNAPYRWDTVGTEGIGLLVPRSLIAITPDLAFFLGHDGFYLYDGARGLASVAQGVTRDILTRINSNALKAGFAWYKQTTGEIHVALPMGSATYPNETWVFNFPEKRVYGPYDYKHTFTAAAPYATTSTLTWDDLTGSWDDLPYTSWDTIGGIASSRAIILGASSGTTWLDDETVYTDANANGVPSAIYTFAPVRASGRMLIMPDGSQRPLEEDGYLTLHDLVLSYRNQGLWTPTISVSVDGGSTWTSATSGTTIGDVGTNTDSTRMVAYTFDGLSGTWFQARVSGSYPMQLTGMKMEFTYGGSYRND